MADEWVLCVTAPDLSTAQVIRSRLEANDIPVMIPDETTAGVAWHLSQAMGGIRVLVPAGQADAAAELLDSQAVAESTGDPPPAAERHDAAGEAEPADHSAGDKLAHRAFKTAVVGTILLIVLPYALSLVLQAVRTGGLSRWGRTRLLFATVISLGWLIGIIVALWLVLAAAPIAP